MADALKPRMGAWSRAPRGVWVLGFVSMLMDISSEMIHGLLPLYLTAVLGATMADVGVIEGVAEATTSVVKVFSGSLSDRLGSRKWLAAFGYGLAALTKPVFPLAGSLGWVVAARFVDRIGKGVRGAPRDALIADITPPDARGAAFGLRQALDTVGAFLGPLVAIAAMWATGDHYRTVFWIAVIPAFLSAALVAVAVREPERERAPPGTATAQGRLGAAFWTVAALGFVFTLARFSEAFLASEAGLPAALSPGVLVLMNVVYAAAAYPAGAMSDRYGRRGPLVAGLTILIVADAALAFPGGLLSVAVGLALWGLHMGLTQGVLSSMVADAVPPDRRGAAFGWFFLITGLATLLASFGAGALWDRIGSSATFLAGAVVAALALIMAWTGSGLHIARREDTLGG